jgi:hypothetical protein
MCFASISNINIRQGAAKHCMIMSAATNDACHTDDPMHDGQTQTQHMNKHAASFCCEFQAFVVLIS